MRWTNQCQGRDDITLTLQIKMICFFRRFHYIHVQDLLKIQKCPLETVRYTITRFFFILIARFLFGISIWQLA